MVLGAHNLFSITTGGLLYHDGTIQWIDFRACAEAAFASTIIPSPYRLDCVGYRNTRKLMVLDVVFFTEPVTCFIFNSYAERDRTLLEPMARLGWYTWDVSGNRRD